MRLHIPIASRMHRSPGLQFLPAAALAVLIDARIGTELHGRSAGRVVGVADDFATEGVETVVYVPGTT